MKFSKGIIAFFFVLFLIPCFLAGASGNAYDVAAQNSINQEQLIGKTPVANELQTYAVLWDTTHGVYLNYQPFVRYTQLVANLADSGYTMECCGTGVHTVDLSQYDVIIIAVGSSWYTMYTQEEVDSLVSYYGEGHERVILAGDMNFCENTYYGNGDNIVFTDNLFDWLAETGGILIMGDNPGCSNVNINPICNAFDMTAGVAGLDPSDLYFTNFAAHPIFNNVSTIYYRAAGEVAGTTPSEPIAWTDTNQPTIIERDETVGIKENISRPIEHQYIGSTILAGPLVLPKDVPCKVFNISGRKVDAARLSPGIYFIEIDGKIIQKVVKIR
ncbi:MAG: T9SS type A sorting domain-containing protein [bacterium]